MSYVMNIIPLAKEASEMTKEYKKVKSAEFKLQGEKAVILKIEKSIKDGMSVASFRLNTSEARWVEDNKQMLRDKGYEVVFFMGRVGTAEIRW